MTTRKNNTLFILFLICAMTLLAACGNTSSSNANSSSQKNSSTSNQTSTTSEDTLAREVQDAFGTKTIQGTPARVVVLEWEYTEDVLALGVQPVGAADITNYKKWVNITPQLADSVTDVGTRQEPNLEVIQSLKPDLIITSKMRSENIKDQLEAIAPTLIYNAYPEEGQGSQYDAMENTFKSIALALNKVEEGNKVLEQVQNSYTEAAQKLQASGKENAPVALVLGYSADNVPHFRLYKNNAMATEILAKIGLKNAYTDEKFELYGFTETTLESLVGVQDANLLYIVQDSDNIIENQLKDNAVWNGLNFVKENRIYPLGGDLWTYGGPLSAQILAEKVVSQLAP